MSEFQEVMKQWRRFCKSHSNCGECEFDGKGICGEAHLSTVSYSDIEQRIMAWAAAHSEPVYPTWIEWFQGIGVVPHEQKIFHNWLLNPIPADFAQKLGIKPKK